MTPSRRPDPIAGLTADYATTLFSSRVRVNTLSRARPRYLTAFPTFLASPKVPNGPREGTRLFQSSFPVFRNSTNPKCPSELYPIGNTRSRLKFICVKSGCFQWPFSTPQPPFIFQNNRTGSVLSTRLNLQSMVPHVAARVSRFRVGYCARAAVRSQSARGVVIGR